MTRNALFALVLSACSTQPVGAELGDIGGGKADDGDATPTIAFYSDFTQSLSGNLEAGGVVRIEYAIDRIQECRSEDHGVQVFGVTGHALFDGRNEVTFPLSEIPDEVVVAIPATIEIPAGTSEIALYFTISDKWGCQAYDSNYGANYRFAVGGGAGDDSVVIDFDASYAETQSGDIHAGDTVIVHYDPARLADVCEITRNGFAAWGIVGYYQIDGGTVQVMQVAAPSGSELIATDAEFVVAAGRDLQMWFECANYTGSHGYDSNDSANYHFAIN